MLRLRRLHWLGIACTLVAFGWTNSHAAEMTGVILAKFGLASMSKTDQVNLWKRVDEYASVDALQEFCGKKLNIQRRAWSAVSDCVEAPSLRKVASVFRSKKNTYLKGWETAYGEPEKKKLICDQWQTKLKEYARIISTQIAEAAKLCRSCIFC